MLLCVCSLIDQRRRQIAVTTSFTHSATPRVALCCSYHILTSTVITEQMHCNMEVPHHDRNLNVRTAVLFKMTYAVSKKQQSLRRVLCKFLLLLFFCLRFGNVKIILNNANPTLSL